MINQFKILNSLFLLLYKTNQIKSVIKLKPSHNQDNKPNLCIVKQKKQTTTMIHLQDYSCSKFLLINMNCKIRAVSFCDDDTILADVTMTQFSQMKQVSYGTL